MAGSQKPTRDAARQQRKAREEAKAQALRRARTRMYVLGGSALVALVVIVLLVAGGSGSPDSPPSTPTPSATSFGGRLPGLQSGNAVWPPELQFLSQRLTDIGLPALPEEGNVLHIHQHLDIFVGGRKVPVPAGIGIAADDSFIAPLHTHDASGIIHVESDVQRTFTLGQFFDVWGVRLDADCIGGYCTGAGRSLTAYVNGRKYSGNPRRITLRSHEEIVLSFGSPSEQPAHIPASYTFPKGY